MQLPEVYIPSFYNAMQQGKADRRTAKLNALQDEFMVNAKKRADQEGEMANEQKKAQYAYNLITQLEKQVAESDRGDAYNSFLLPELQKLYPETQLPQTYSPTALGGLKVKVKSLLPRSVEKVGDQLVVVQGDEAYTIAGTPKSDFSTVTQTFIDQGTGAQYAKDVPKQTDIFGNIHIGGMVAVRGYPDAVPLKDYEAYLQANVSPEQFQKYQSTRVNIPVSQGQQTGAQRVPNFMPQGAPQPSVPSPQNTAGRTNQGFAISEDAVPQPSAPAQLRFEDLINPDGSIRVPQRQAPTIDYGSEPPPVAMQSPEMGVNALMGDSMMPEGVNRFAMLKPFGSEPNRFGSPAVEGMEQAYVGNARQVGRAPQPNQPNKVTKEDLLILASKGDPQALAQIKRMNEIEQSIKGQKVPDRVFKEFQQVKADMQGVRDTLITMRQSRSDLASGRINLSALSRGSNVPLSILGLQSDTQDRTDTFISNMQAQANALLLENKGVQTDGDAKRAMSQIAQPLAYVNNKKMINALDNGIITLDRLYKKQMSKFADYNKQYPAIGGQ